ncbi:MAG TPA: diguanylate cyclase [Gallionella sp.]|nr:diguanylate cyclase [Gallionella sp.]
MLDNFERKQGMQDRRLYVMERVSALRAKLEAAISGPVAAARALAVVYATHPELSRGEFVRLAEQARTFSPGIVNIALIRGSAIDDVYPVEGNEKLIGMDFRNLPGQWPAFRKMMDARQAVAAGPMTLVQGGQAVVVRIPVFRAPPASGTPASGTKDFIGAISAPILFDAVLREAGLPDVEENMVVAIRGRDGRGSDGAMIYGSPDTFAMQPVLQQVSVPGGSWEIGVYPRAGWDVASPLLRIIRGLGAALCLLAAGMAYGLVRHLQRRAENELRLQNSEARLKQRSAELIHQNAVLEMINHSARLPDILEMLAQLVEIHHPEMLCAILLVDRDGTHLRYGGAPNLPDGYRQTVDGLAIGEGMGACGTAAFRGERVVLENILTHPYCAGQREFLQRANLQSCWSQPIKGHDGRVLGAFAIYHRYPASPLPTEITMIENYAALAALAIERTTIADDLRLHDAALNAAANAIIITDRQARIVWANQAFTKLTGYSFSEVAGRHCGELIKSGLQDAKFYAEMWLAILSGHVWHGELTNRRKDGTLYRDEMTVTPVRNQDGEIANFVALKQDITARKLEEVHLQNLAFYDPLTQLPNRRLLMDRLGQAQASSKRSGHYGALMFLDLDNFKPLNDRYGHDVGDLLLREVARRLSNCIRQDDTVARLGGDEFVVLVKELDTEKEASAKQATLVAEKVRAALANPCHLELLQAEDGKTAVDHRCTCSIGVVLFINHEPGLEEILKCADIAMYQAKSAGRNRINFYDAVCAEAIDALATGRKIGSNAA